jgi:uncharacterized protein
MRLDLHDLALRGGERHEASHFIDFGPVVLGGVEYRILLPHGVDIAVDRVAGGFVVTLTAAAKVYGPCTRCIEEVALEVRAEEQEFAPTAGGTWGESEVSPFISDLVVDVEGIAREAVILALPGQLLCSPGCRGLCARCGRDLNQGPCGCSALEISPEVG